MRMIQQDEEKEATIMNAEKETPVAAPELTMLQKSNQAFHRDLPTLLKTHYRQWVVYSGDKRLGFGRTKTELYQKCLRDGLGPDQFRVRFVYEDALHDNEETQVPSWA